MIILLNLAKIAIPKSLQVNLKLIVKESNFKSCIEFRLGCKRGIVNRSGVIFTTYRETIEMYAPTIIRRKLLRKPLLNKCNKNVRVKFTRSKMNRGGGMKKRNFLKEKCNWDGPDGIYYI